MRQAAGFHLPKKRLPARGRPTYAVCRGAYTIAREDCILEPLQHYGFPFGRVFLLSACFCEFQKKPNLLDHRLATIRLSGPPLPFGFELPSTATADSDYPTKPEAMKANAKTAPLAAVIEVVQTAGRQTWVCQPRRSLVQIWTLILTNYDTNLELN
jgi:hypothetical protein